MTRNILDYLEQSAQNYPDKVAFADPKAQLTFAQLKNQAQAVASGLLELPECSGNHRIAVAVDRTVQSLVAILGVVYSGGCYVPLDVHMPVDRMRTILETCQPAAVIDGTGRHRLPEQLQETYPVLSYDDLVQASLRPASLSAARARQTDQDPLYIIFTSGSTGKPKGVCVSHRAVIDFTEWLTETMQVSSRDILGNQAPFYFDMAGKDIYQTLKTGCTTYIFPPMLFSFTGKLMRELNDKKVTTLFWAAAAVRMVAASGALGKNPPRHIHKIGFGGEALPVRWMNVWKQAVPGIQFMNMYGPTEATIDCMYYLVDRDFTDDEALPMGKACENMRVLLLDEDQKEIRTPGVKGEICVTGTGLALGYFNDPERTAQVFKQNPTNHAYPETIYRTGDMAQFGTDGLLYFAGRKDNQIKHMGYRIELGEIETKVTAIPDIDVCACIFDQEQDEIVLFYQGTISAEDLKRTMDTLLPKYMLPNVILKKDALPYNANNKIDRVTLKKEYLDGTPAKL